MILDKEREPPLALGPSTSDLKWKSVCACLLFRSFSLLSSVLFSASALLICSASPLFSSSVPLSWPVLLFHAALLLCSPPQFPSYALLLLVSAPLFLFSVFSSVCLLCSSVFFLRAALLLCFSSALFLCLSFALLCYPLLFCSAPLFSFSGLLFSSVLFFFLARCCFGKILGGASFSQLHKSDKQSRVDKP